MVCDRHYGGGEKLLSQQLINEYRAKLDRLRAVSGSRRETVVREPFKDLLKSRGHGQQPAIRGRIYHCQPHLYRWRNVARAARAVRILESLA
jgi:hypothetical protein